ncbi:MAG: DUF1573 domain-containing protein [Verrucomicrobiae bacterium]|nr:DUF1573 domain-containing protein [Verrucomicrobiae bacterium]
MNRFLLFACGLLTLCSLQHSALAGLDFASTHLTVEAAPELDELPVQFTFQAEGDKAVEILEVQTTCGCLKAKADKKVYKSGEKGVIDCVFSVGSFEGQHIKSVYVITSDEENSRIPLKVTFNVPLLFEIEPQQQKWKVGEEPVAKKVSFKVLYKDPVEILELTSSREAFSAEFKEIVKGREYEIMITPSDTSKPMLGALSIMTNCPIERHRKKLVFFSITRR